MYSVSLISRYMESPTELHLLAAKRILRYLQGTRNLGIYYKKGEKSNLMGYTDSDYAGDQDDGRSTSGYVFYSWNRCNLLVIKEATNCHFIQYKS